MRWSELEVFERAGMGNYVLWKATHVLYTANRGEQVHSDRVEAVRAEGPESEVCFLWFPMVLEPHIDSVIGYVGEDCM